MHEITTTITSEIHTYIISCGCLMVCICLYKKIFVYSEIPVGAPEPASTVSHRKKKTALCSYFFELLHVQFDYTMSRTMVKCVQMGHIHILLLSRTKSQARGCFYIMFILEMSWDFYIKRSSLAREDMSSLARGHVFSCKRRRVLSCKRRHVFL